MSDQSGFEVQNLPALARLAAGMSWRATKWGMIASARTGMRFGLAAADPVLTAEVVAQLGYELREYARDLLGITELDERVRELMPVAEDAGAGNGKVPEAVGLRIKGALLLRAAAEVDHEEQAHPAYARILTELAPDEGRVLRLLAREGPQPAVDVRSTGLIGSSEHVAEELNMVGAQAGCQYRDRMPAHLNNLERLGLIFFSDDPLDDAVAYQVLEAQPEVMEAIKEATRAKTIQRSIRLTPFGRDFCMTCLPLDPGEVEALAPHPDDH
jgi:hypothetical protein